MRTPRRIVALIPLAALAGILPCAATEPAAPPTDPPSAGSAPSAPPEPEAVPAPSEPPVSATLTRTGDGSAQNGVRLSALDLDVLGPPIQTDPQFPNRTNTSFWTELAPDTIRARIFERGVGETLSSGTGASGAAVAHVLRGGDSPVTVRLDGGELEVDVDESLHVDLTGWAVPVYRGELSPELVAELGSTA